MMKQKIRFRCAFLITAVIFISAISGCKQNNTAVKMFKVSFDKENAGGDVTAKIKGSKFILSGAEVKEGTTVVFTARPDDDYGVQEWKGITAPSADAATVEVTVNSNIDVKVAFVKNRFIVNFVNENAGGSVSAKIKDGKALTNGEKVHAGAKVVFTAEHEEGYSVKEWKGITATPANADTVEVTVNGNIDVKVVFVGNYYTVNFTNENEGGTVSAKIKDGKTLSSGEKVQAGNIIVFTAEAGSNYEVKEWKGITATPANAATAELKLRGNVDVKVVFEKNTFEIYITGDSNINVTKDPGQDFAVLTVKKKSNKWADIKTSAEEKVSLKDGSKYEICLWKVADKDNEKGGMLKDDYIFTAGTKIMAISIPKDNFVKACNAQVKIDGKAPSNEGAWYKGVFWDTRKIKIRPYNIAATEVTYQLWYPVRIWAEANGYIFQNKGNEGSMYGKVGTEPTENSIHPVTIVHWRDCIVWCNAYTEMTKGEESCVYRKDSESGEILKNSNQSFSLFKTFMDTKKDGYRLPTEVEWEYAARYQGDGSDPKHQINAEENGTGVWLTKLDSASGAADNTEEEAEKFAWVKKIGTNPVAKLQANALGLYDMSGNVYEWCFDFFDSTPGSNDEPDSEGYTLCPLGPDKGVMHVLRGGWYAADIPLYSVGFRTKKDDATYQRGFRLASNSN